MQLVCREILMTQYLKMFNQVQAAVTVNGCLGSAGGHITEEVNLLGEGRQYFVNVGIDTDKIPRVEQSSLP